jgi:protein-S-isoprenylcysteine O-methyltransferase Ste14
MEKETTFRALFILSFIAMFGIRVFSQLRARRWRGKVEIRETSPSLIAGSIAALVAIVFGAEYIFFPGTFNFAYALKFPLALRWIGAFFLLIGITLLGVAHYHLDKNFNSFVVTMEGQKLVTSGPYRWIRHPIYTAYLLNYLGGGLLAGNLILTFVPTILFGILVALRVKPEEGAMIEQFGNEYRDYMKRTGRFLPRFN